MRLGSSLLLVLVIFVGMEMLVRQMLYPAPSVAVPSPPPSPYEEVWLETSAGDRVHGWFREAGTAGEGPSVLFFHGNGENLATLAMAGLFDEFARLGASVLAIDYPGYGRSSGSPSEASLMAAGLAAHDWLVERSAGRLPVVVGWSLGAAVAVGTAAERRCGGLVLQSAWHDLPSVAKLHVPAFLVKVALRDRYASGERVPEVAKKVEGSVLLLHGDRDALIPIAEGRRLFRAFEGRAEARFVTVEPAGHNDLLGRREVWEEVRRMLRE